MTSAAATTEATLRARLAALAPLVLEIHDDSAERCPNQRGRRHDSGRPKTSLVA